MNLLKQYKLADKVYQGSISNKDLITVKKLLKIPLKQIKKIAELRNINTKTVDKQDILIRLLKSHQSIKESQYLSLFNKNPSNKIDNKINEIKIMLIEYDNKLTNKEITKFTKELYNIKTMIDCYHESRVNFYPKLSKELKFLLDPVIRNRRIKKVNLNAIIKNFNKLITKIKFLRKDRIISDDDHFYTGLKDHEYIFGDIDDYYKPTLTKQSFYDPNTSTFNHQVYVYRGTSKSTMSIESYFDKVQPHLIQLIKEKQTNKQKIQIVIGVKFIYPITKKQFVCYIHTDNLKVIPTDDEYTVLNELFHNFLIKYQEKIHIIGQGSVFECNDIEDLSIRFRKIDRNRGS